MSGVAPTAIIVVNYGSHALLRDRLAAVSVPVNTFRVIVVDNASTETERSAVTALGRRAGWTVLTRADNGGFGAGVNAGLRRALADGCSSFILLNPDVEPDIAVFEALRDQVIAQPAAVVSPVLLCADGGVEFAGSALDLRDGRIRSLRGRTPGPSERSWLPATCLALHRDLLARVGLFDEPYFLYWEDVDFTRRCAAAGAQLLVRDDLSVVHAGGGTQGPRRGVAKSALYYRYNCRNRLLFAARHLDRRDLLRWLLATPRCSWLILLQGGRRQLLHSPRSLLSAAVGSLAGVGIAVRSLLSSPAAESPGQPTFVAHDRRGQTAA